MSVILPMISKHLPVLIAKDILGVQSMDRPRGSPHKKKYWPYQYTLDYSTLYLHLAEVERWCYANFKSRNWRNAGAFFAFKRAEDYSIFLLRWSQ